MLLKAIEWNDRGGDSLLGFVSDQWVTKIKKNRKKNRNTVFTWAEIQ